MSHNDSQSAQRHEARTTEYAIRHIMTLKEISRNKAFNGHLIKYEHDSNELNCTMKFNVFLPEQSAQGKVPGLYFLSGLTCNEDNFVQKSGALKEAAKHGIALIAPDTSPRKSLCYFNLMLIHV